MEENGDNWSPPPPPKRRVPPTITIPSRSSLDTLVPGLSPGPMTLVSNFFADHYPDNDLSSFSQLLAEVLPSPIAPSSFAPLINHELSSNCQNLSEGCKKNRQVMVPQSSNLETEPIVCVSKPASDGYNWRKYGQKLVKTSELPRCYYKCSQIDCPVTKKIGHFLNGNISDIIYNGQHNHEPPLCPKRAKYGAPADQHMRFIEEPADVRQQNNHIVPNEVMTDERKRKMEVGSGDLFSSPRVIITGPKIMVQTRSEVDILDDGFKWRKYGQKVVKGNTYPRGYYRCAYAGCKVRKHVERAFSDPKSVVTTYEGKHKHDIPVVAKPSSSNVTNLKTETPFLLQLKEEQITT